MTDFLNETHNPELRSWVGSANVAGCDFPIQNLPFASFKRSGSSEPMRIGVAIGTEILDLTAAAKTGVFSDQAAEALQAAAQPTLNALMALGKPCWSALRLALSRALREGAAQQSALQSCLVPQAEVEYALPAQIGDYTDFYTSIHHATNIGRLFRPDNPLMPNYQWVPIGYHGRASSVVISVKTLRVHAARSRHLMHLHLCLHPASAWILSWNWVYSLAAAIRWASLFL